MMLFLFSKLGGDIEFIGPHKIAPVTVFLAAARRDMDNTCSLIFTDHVPRDDPMRLPRRKRAGRSEAMTLRAAEWKVPAISARTI